MNWLRNPPSGNWTEPGGALNIKSGAELEGFDLGTFRLAGSACPVLTGHEVLPNTCRFCGKPIEGKRRAGYCRGRSHADFTSCFRLYWQYFEWGSASRWALERAQHRCENCGRAGSLQVHHIVPLNGTARFFSAHNLPWNLIVLCRKCHLEVHASMRPPKLNTGRWDNWQEAEKVGQSVMRLE